MKDWNEATAYACSLPEVEMASWWGTLCPKINARGFMSPGREAGSFALAATNAEKEILFETDAETFWQTDHYRNYPMLLVRYGTDADERIRLYIQRAYWDRAKKPQRVAAGMAERP